MRTRATCENKDRCGTTGHYRGPTGIVRCECMEAEIQKKILGPMFTEGIQPSTKLEGKKDADLVIEGPLASVRKHIARVLLNMKSKGETWLTLDAYRFLEIFLGEDKEHESQFEAIDPDLLVLLLGFADPRNKYLPELIMQVLARREMLHKPTWIVLNLPVDAVAAKYNSALGDRLTQIQKVLVK